MIKITDKLEYDETLSFNEQSEEVKNFIITFTNSNEPISKVTEPAGYFPRPINEVFQINKELQITKTYSYIYPGNHESNGLVKEINYERT